jgi:putative phosphoesterase
MLLAVISDLHDNLANLDKCLDWCRAHAVAKMIFCGDTTTLETLNYLAANFRGEIFMVRGNIELYDPGESPLPANVDYHGEYGRLDIDGVRIGLCHEPQEIKKVLTLSPIAPDFIFYGHTHKPWLEKRGETVIANPGNLAGTFHPATFATLDTTTKKLELKIVADL